MDFQAIFDQNKVSGLDKRYINLKDIEPFLKSLPRHLEVNIAGRSVLNKPIYTVTIGNGATRIYIWSQMHGNESTTTRAVIDFINLLSKPGELSHRLVSHFTFHIVPIANPDGAGAYTRVNANDIDLNRDSEQLSQPESRILREQFETFKPHYCYNMHDQRTIFGVGEPPLPATVSFLAPAYNEKREINEPRETAIRLIIAMARTLQEYIPGQIGRFDDSFNSNCIGDMFQSLGVPTVLFEAGHYQNDYNRDYTRKFVFFALIAGFQAIYENVLVKQDLQDYFIIPQNQNVFYDLMYKNIKINYENKEKITNIASQYEEVLIDNSVKFRAVIREIGKCDGFSAHAIYDACGADFENPDGTKIPVSGSSADFSIDGLLITNGVPGGN